jgi:transposase InsO family protein
MAHEILLREGSNINKKPTQRLWRDEGLRRPQRCAKRRRPRVDSAVRQGAEYPNHGVWAIDFQFNETSDYRRLKLLNIVDEFTRESLAMEVDRSITADRLIDVVEGLVVVYRAPEHLRMDNGPELCSWALRDWCRFTGTSTIYIEPGSPRESRQQAGS